MTNPKVSSALHNFVKMALTLLLVLSILLLQIRVHFLIHLRVTILLICIFYTLCLLNVSQTSNTFSDFRNKVQCMPLEISVQIFFVQQFILIILFYFALLKKYFQIRSDTVFGSRCIPMNSSCVCIL